MNCFLLGIKVGSAPRATRKHAHSSRVDVPVLARHARAVAAANGFQDVIVVLQGAVEDLQQELEPVDVLVSEWMGYLLVRSAARTFKKKAV